MVRLVEEYLATEKCFDKDEGEDLRLFMFVVGNPLVDGQTIKH